MSEGYTVSLVAASSSGVHHRTAEWVRRSSSVQPRVSGSKRSTSTTNQLSC